jgi:putative transposase
MHDSGGVYYVVLRGNGRHPMFIDEEDYLAFGRLVEETIRGSEATVHAFCWTPIEARLAVRIAYMPIAQFAQQLAEKHTRRADRDVSLTGSHFERKARGVLIDGHSALLELVRHIHLAPVKAGLAEDPAGYRWSSHRAYMGVENVPWLTLRDVFACLAQGGADPLTAYRRLMEHGLERTGTSPPDAGQAESSREKIP